MENYDDLQQAAQSLDQDEWIEHCKRSTVETTMLDGIPLPSAPSAELQAAFVGHSGPKTMAEAAMFYDYVLDANDRFRGQGIGRMLDFGCGWGRYTRLFIRDVPDSGLYGADSSPLAVQVCRRHIPYACFVLSDVRPPLPFRDQFFDVVIAYSVFSHLSELHAANWIYELSRVLRPGGLLIATTHAPRLLDRVERMQLGQEPAETQWHENLLRSWPDVAVARSRYEAGEFVFAESGEYKDGYGDVLVPKQYVWNEWGRYMEPLEFVDDHTRIAQAAFVLRKNKQG